VPPIASVRASKIPKPAPARAEVSGASRHPAISATDIERRKNRRSRYAEFVIGGFAAVLVGRWPASGIQYIQSYGHRPVNVANWRRRGLFDGARLAVLSGAASAARWRRAGRQQGRGLI